MNVLNAILSCGMNKKRRQFYVFVKGIEIVQDPDFPLPDDEEYVSGSLDILGNEDYIRDFYNDGQEDDE